jgi:hypothetical protein
LKEKQGWKQEKETRVTGKLRFSFFSFSLQPGMKLVCAQEYKVKTAQRAENTKVGRRRCRGKSDTRHKKIKKKRRKERQGGTARAKRKRERERERKENKGGQGLKIK